MPFVKWIDFISETVVLTIDTNPALIAGDSEIDSVSAELHLKNGVVLHVGQSGEVPMDGEYL